METARLILRPWQPEDAQPFAHMNADPRVMEYLPARLDREQSDALMNRIIAHFETHGFGLWVVETKYTGDFAGCVGLLNVPGVLPFAPALELAWRLDPAHWGRGYATEAARYCLDFAFTRMAADRVVAYTVPANKASWRVMERIGLVRDAGGDFDHPALPVGHRLRRHVLYRLARADWRADVRPRQGLQES
ncbi:MAG: GNAT family N-acetyltransferase [Rhodospirillaceae bacterium]